MEPLFGLVDAEPFRPFQIDLQNGRQIRVDHPENIFFFPHRRRVKVILVYYPKPDDYSLFYPEGITALHVISGNGGDGNET
jgi:hypothetical protein